MRTGRGGIAIFKIRKPLCWVGWHKWFATPAGFDRCTCCGWGREFGSDGKVSWYDPDEVLNLALQHIAMKYHDELQAALDAAPAASLREGEVPRA